MPDDSSSSAEKPLHPNAAAKIRAFVDEFATSLVLQSKLLAFRDRADEVLGTHVEQALEIVKYKEHKGWVKELCTVVGAAFFGAFVPGFIDALPRHDSRALVIYTALGIVGMFLVFLGIKD